MKLKLTELKCLQECEKIWSELAKTGAKYKDSVKIALEYKHLCPCCEYVEQFPYIGVSYGYEPQKKDCDKCPLASYWGGHGEARCDRAESNYGKWNSSWHSGPKYVKLRKKYARLIAQACTRRIKKIKEKK